MKRKEEDKMLSFLLSPVQVSSRKSANGHLWQFQNFSFSFPIFFRKWWVQLLDFGLDQVVFRSYTVNTEQQTANIKRKQRESTNKKKCKKRSLNMCTEFSSKYLFNVCIESVELLLLPVNEMGMRNIKINKNVHNQRIQFFFASLQQ